MESGFGENDDGEGSDMSVLLKRFKAKKNSAQRQADERKAALSKRRDERRGRRSVQTNIKLTPEDRARYDTGVTELGYDTLVDMVEEAMDEFLDRRLPKEAKS